MLKREAAASSLSTLSLGFVSLGPWHTLRQYDSKRSVVTAAEGTSNQELCADEVQGGLALPKCRFSVVSQQHDFACGCGPVCLQRGNN